jgi:hypothetical protein
MVNKTLPASGAGLEKPRAREWRGLSLQRSLHGAAKFKERLFIFAAVAIGIAARVSIAGAGFGVGEKKHGPKVATASTIGWGAYDAKARCLWCRSLRAQVPIFNLSLLAISSIGASSYS